MLKRTIALLVTLALTLPGCAAATAPRFQVAAAPPRSESRTLVAEFVQKLPIGSRVRVHLEDGRRERGTLMDATADRLVIQPRARIPEPPHEIPLDRVLAVELEYSNGNVAKAVGIGIAAGAGTFLGILMLFAAAYAD